MKVIGLTGGIGSGKTLISNLFAELGVPVYISDIEAKKLMHTNINVKNAIIKLFGEEAYINGKLYKQFIAEKVFSNKTLLEKLNAIVHPAVAENFEAWKKLQKSDFVIKEAAILFETGGNNKCDKVILVTAPKSIRIKRVVERDQVSAVSVEKRMNNQWSDNQKKKMSDYVINNINFEDTKRKVLKIYESLKN